jgi:serine protease Do
LTSNPGSELETLLDSFVRVRLVQMGGVDLSVFQFDPFLSWSLFFMNADRTIYGRFGTASPSTKLARKDSNPNHTTAGLAAALRRALQIHADYEKDPETWSKILAGKTGPKPYWNTVETFPAALAHERLGRIEGADPQQCTHCHEVQRTLIDSYFLTGKRIADNMLWVYPQPGVLGLELSLDHCARVVRVDPGSFAARAGVEPGDDLLTAAGQPLVSIADLQFVLQNFPDAGGALPLRVRRGDRERDLEITLPDLWRRAEDFGWRYRVAGYSMWLWAGVTLEDHPEGVRVAQRSPGWFKKPNRDARRAFEPGDVIVEADGRKGWTRSTFLAYLMREKALGSTVRLEVIRGGRTVPVRFEIPETRPELQGH